MIVGSAPAERAGAAAALWETGSELGGALGIAIIGSLGTAVYRRELASAVSATLPPDVVEAARGTLGTAMSVAEGISGDAGLALARDAHLAFTHALRLSEVISAVVMAGTAVLVAVLLRHGRAASTAH